MSSLYAVDVETKLTETVDYGELQLYEFLNTSISGTCGHRKCSVNTQMYTDDNDVTCGKKNKNLKDIDHRTYCVEVKEYSPIAFKNDIGRISRDERVRKVSVSWSCSQSFVEEIPEVCEFYYYLCKQNLSI
jgi:hypothetical protein